MLSFSQVKQILSGLLFSDRMQKLFADLTESNEQEERRDIISNILTQQNVSGNANHKVKLAFQLYLILQTVLPWKCEPFPCT